MRRLLFVLPLLAAPLAAQTPADSAAWRRAMAVDVAKFLLHDAPRGGLTIQSADSSDWGLGFLLDVTRDLDSLKLRTPGDSAQGKVTFSGPMNFEQPYGGIPRQLLQLQMTESTCIYAPGGVPYLSGATYNVRLFTRGISFFTDITFVETPEGTCSR